MILRITIQTWNVLNADDKDYMHLLDPEVLLTVCAAIWGSTIVGLGGVCLGWVGLLHGVGVGDSRVMPQLLHVLCK